MYKILSKPLEYFLMLCLILECNSLYKYSSVGNFLKYGILITSIILILINYTQKNKISKSIFIKIKYVILTILSISLVYLLFNISSALKIISFFLIPIILFFILNIIYFINKSFSLLEVYVNIIVILSLISLFFWIFSSLTNLIEETGYVYNLWIGENIIVRSYYGVYFETQTIPVFNNIVFRNSGIFTEGPMFNLVLSLALIINVLLLKSSKLKSIVIIITMLTTITTTGYIVIILLIVYIFWSKINYGITTIFFIIMSIYISFFLIDNKTNIGSTEIRMDDYKAGMLSWFDNIIMGNGYGNMENIYKYMDLTIRNNLGYSNSIFLVLSQGGIILSLILLLPIFIAIYNCNINYKFFSIIVLFIISTAIYFNTMMFLFLISIIYCLLLINGNNEDYINRKRWI